MTDIKLFCHRIYNRVYLTRFKKRMGACGEDVLFGPWNSVFTYESMYVGSNVNIAYHSDFVANRSKIIIKGHVVLPPPLA